jgi:hypothetical protein
MTGEGEEDGGGAISYDDEKACSSINHSILSGQTLHKQCHWEKNIGRRAPGMIKKKEIDLERRKTERK